MTYTELFQALPSDLQGKLRYSLDRFSSVHKNVTMRTVFKGKMEAFILESVEKLHRGEGFEPNPEFSMLNTVILDVAEATKKEGEGKQALENLLRQDVACHLSYDSGVFVCVLEKGREVTATAGSLEGVLARAVAKWTSPQTRQT